MKHTVLEDWQLEEMKKGNGIYRDLYKKINNLFGKPKYIHTYTPLGQKNVKTK